MLTTRSLNWTEGNFTFLSRCLCKVRCSRKKLKLRIPFHPGSVHGYLNEAILLRKDAFAQPRGSVCTAIFKFGPRRIVSRQHMQVQEIDLPRTYGSFPISNNIDHVIPQPVKEEADAKYAYSVTGLLLRR